MRKEPSEASDGKIGRGRREAKGSEFNHGGDNLVFT